MISINLGSCHFQRGDSAELQELREALTSANHSWTQACSGLESWEGRLHSALMQCQVRDPSRACTSTLLGGQAPDGITESGLCCSGVPRDAALAAAVARPGGGQAEHRQPRRPVNAERRPAAAPSHAGGE